jgi:hypothetical protein
MAAEARDDSDALGIGGSAGLLTRPGCSAFGIALQLRFDYGRPVQANGL